MDIGEIRKEYTKSGLNKADMKHNPLEQFEFWFEQARAAELKEVNAMSIATVRPDGMPQGLFFLPITPVPRLRS